MKIDKPCMYKWGDWSNCSAECAPDRKKIPTKQRQVISGSVIHARGKYMSIAPCPENIETLIDYAPCNTHRLDFYLRYWLNTIFDNFRCPVPLSSFPFLNRNFSLNLKESPSECYRIREIPTENILIHIDTTELYQKADCPKD